MILIYKKPINIKIKIIFNFILKKVKISNMNKYKK